MIATYACDRCGKEIHAADERITVEVERRIADYSVIQMFTGQRMGRLDLCPECGERVRKALGKEDANAQA